MTNIFEGKLIRLRAIEPGDWQAHYEWDQDTELARTLDQIYFPRSTERTRQWAETGSVRDPQNDAMQLQIETLDQELVGSISSHSCDLRNGIFSYGVAIRPEHQRKGYATEAITLLLGYFFHELRYQKAMAQVHAFNEPSMRLHEHYGFTLEGRLRRMIFTHGQYFDALVYGLTDDEYAQRAKTGARK